MLLNNIFYNRLLLLKLEILYLLHYVITPLTVNTVVLYVAVQMLIMIFSQESCRIKMAELMLQSQSWTIAQ